MTEEEFRKGPTTAEVVPTDPLMQFFAVGHPDDDFSALIDGHFWQAAQAIITLPRNAERTVALRKLLEARDCAMRAAVMK